jgi:2-phosphosulfolactate phosphatase
VAGVLTIGCFHAHLSGEEAGTAIVAVDVLRSTTTAVTAVAKGRQCFPAASIEAAVPLAARLSNPLLVGELGGSMPYGFHLQNSPAEIERRTDTERPMVLLSTSGTRLMCEAAASGAAYATCLRNVTAQVKELHDGHDRVALLGADSRGEFRAEDQLCCARIAAPLFEAGYEPGDEFTERVVEKWMDASEDTFVGGRSSQYLIDTGQRPDLDFVLSHIDDLDGVFPVTDGRVVMRAPGLSEA